MAGSVASSLKLSVTRNGPEKIRLTNFAGIYPSKGERQLSDRRDLGFRQGSMIDCASLNPEHFLFPTPEFGANDSLLLIPKAVTF